MKLNDAQLAYLHDGWRIPIDRMRPLDAYRGWVNIGSCARCPDYIESIILCDDDGRVQYSFMTDGDLPGEDSFPVLTDEDEYDRSDYYS
mgnify:CR=1 FL=1